MDVLNFSSYAKAIEKGMINPDHTEITRLLLGFIIDRDDVTNKNGEQYFIDSNTAHQWWLQKEEIPRNIKIAASRPDVQETVNDYFDEKVLNVLSQPKDADTYSTLHNLITQQDMSDDTRLNLLELKMNNELSEFLAQTFIYAIQKTNKNKKVSTNVTKNLIEDDVKQFQILLSKLQKPISLIPPNDLGDHELKYVYELFAAYAEAEGLEYFTKDDFIAHRRYKKDFERQRKNYYAAESVRQSIRDTLLPIESKDFEILKEETYDGIVPVYDRTYPNGYERLYAVMQHATIVRINKSLLAQLPGWIGASETQGVCHMLVNDEKIRWVDEDV